MNRPRRRGSRDRWLGLARVWLWAGGLFVLGQALLTVGILSGQLPVHDPLYQTRAQLLLRRWQSLPEPTYKVLVLGSSRVMLALDAQAVCRADSSPPVEVFNFGIPASGPLTHNLYLRRLLACGVRPDWVICDVVPGFLAGQVTPAMEANWLHAERLLSREEAQRLRGFGLDLGTPPAACCCSWLLPSLAYRKQLLNLYAPVWVPLGQRLHPLLTVDAAGSQAPLQLDPAPEPAAIRLRQTRDQYARYLDGLRVGGPSYAALRDTAALCQQLGIACSVLLMPESHDYRAWYAAESLRDLDDSLERLRQQAGVTIIDARDWLDDADFADGHHVQPSGNRRFTARLGQFIHAHVPPHRRLAGAKVDARAEAEADTEAEVVAPSGKGG
jgi:hypothetical protein